MKIETNPKKFIQKTLPVGRLQCNCQILVCTETREAVLVDPGDESPKILKAIQSIEENLGGELNIKALFHTHAHFDHIGATRGVKEAFLAQGKTVPQIFLHQADEEIYKILVQQGLRFGMKTDEPLPVDRYLNHEEKLKVGKMKFSIIHTPGHSPGGVCFRMHEDSAQSIPETLFTGDTLFRESVGRSDFWGGDQAVLEKSIKERIYTLDDETLAWPGHGVVTSVGHEKRYNPYVRL